MVYTWKHHRPFYYMMVLEKSRKVDIIGRYALNNYMKSKNLVTLFLCLRLVKGIIQALHL